jgi:hypothetical protein
VASIFRVTVLLSAEQGGLLASVRVGNRRGFAGVPPSVQTHGYRKAKPAEGARDCRGSFWLHLTVGQCRTFPLPLRVVLPNPIQISENDTNISVFLLISLTVYMVFMLDSTLK